MKKLLSIVAAMAFAAITANAAQNPAASSSTKPWLYGRQVPAPKTEANVYPVDKKCSLCKVPVTINEQVATKPGHGTIQTTVTADQCPSCGVKMVRELKQVKYVHTCTNHCCGA
jgi:hypothetical protein